MADEWYQQQLTSPEVLEAHIRVGVIPSQDHAQVLAELKDPTTGVLLAQWSSPHVSVRDVWQAIDLAKAKVDVWLGDACEPF